MANRNWMSGGKIYSMHVKPVLLDCNFIVDTTAANGITSLKGPCISAVYMHSTHATPSSVNPAAGTIVVRLSDAYNRSFVSGLTAKLSPNSGSDVKIDNSALIQGVAYTITTLGNATAAKWHTIGVPAGVTPAVGVSFIALSNGGTGNTLTSRVQVPAATGSGIATVECIGDPNLSINPSPSANQGYGGQIILQCRDYAGVLANPTNASTISLSFYLSDSSITVQGE